MGAYDVLKNDLYNVQIKMLDYTNTLRQFYKSHGVYKILNHYGDLVSVDTVTLDDLIYGLEDTITSTIDLVSRRCV